MYSNADPINNVIIRSYPKVLFFFPLFFSSMTFWLIQSVMATEIKWLGFLWIVIFTCNLVVVAFDIGTMKFLIVILGTIIALFLFVFFCWEWFIVWIFLPSDFTLGITTIFYTLMTFIIGAMLIGIIIESYFDYWKLERNEIYHRKGFFTAERYPSKNLRIKKEVTDVFEFLVLRAGALTLNMGKEIVYLPTVLRINKKAEQIDYLLSHISVEPDELP